MIYLFIAFLCLLPFGHIFFKQVDIWHGQGQFAQLGILILFCYSFFENPKLVKIFNKPLGAFLCWAGIVTSYWWITAFAAFKSYPIKIFLPFFNLLCLVLLYRLVIEYLDSRKIEKILGYLKYSLILVLLYCVLQYFNFDELFKNSVNNGRDVLVGTIGQPSHLGSLLAIVSPLFFEKKRESMLVLVLLWIVILLTNSAIGLVCGVLVFLFWLFFKNRKLAWWFSGASLIGFIYLVVYHASLFSTSGRFIVWQKAFELFQKKAILGRGIGSFGCQKINIINYGTFQHLHNEYYQVAFELGIVGLILVVWIIKDYFKTFKGIKTELSIKLASIFFGFCLVSLFNFVGHLWMISVIAIFAYASLYCIKNEVISENKA